MKKYFLMGSLFFALILLAANTSYAQDSGTLVPDKVELVKAQTLSIESQQVKNVPGTDINENFQNIKAKILEGDEAGKEITVENDFLSLKPGEIFYLNITISHFDGKEYYSVDQPYRLSQILILTGIFLVILFMFGGIQGVRGLLSLALSFLLIIYVLLPEVLKGVSPILMTLGVSSLIIIIGSYITHGFNKTTSAAVIGMITTLIVTGILGYWAVHFTRLSGFGTEEATYLNLNTRGSIDMLGLLFGGIMIGLLGVLYDIAIGQAISVEELLEIAPHVSKKKIYERAIRIGREHIGALVNTLAIAYVGVSLPLLLLFYVSTDASIGNIMNREIFSAEIVRTLIGSIGIILAVPITTLISVKFLTRNKEVVADKNILEKEEEAIKHIGHF